MAVLETERLILRPLTLEAVDALAVLYADPDVMRFFEGVRTREQTRQETGCSTNGTWSLKGIAVSCMLWAEKQAARMNVKRELQLPDPDQGHAREWPSPLYSDEVRTVSEGG